jgi:hypothetical protein
MTSIIVNVIDTLLLSQAKTPQESPTLSVLARLTYGK